MGHLGPYFEHVALGYHQELLRPGARIAYLWFPDGGIQSQVVETMDGDSVEVALVGAEGMGWSSRGLRRKITQRIGRSRKWRPRHGVSLLKRSRVIFIPITRCCGGSNDTRPQAARDRYGGRSRTAKAQPDSQRAGKHRVHRRTRASR